MTILEIEVAIAKLPPDDFRELARWIDERQADAWDRQIEEDSLNGKLQRMYVALTKESDGQPSIPLAEFLDEIAELEKD